MSKKEKNEQFEKAINNIHFRKSNARSKLIIDVNPISLL